MSLPRLGLTSLLAATVSLSASLAHPQRVPIAFDRLTVADGLSSNVVYAAIQDRNGYLWFGTVNGLNRYDGQDFRVYQHRPGDTSSLSDNRVFALVEGEGGTIWVGTQEGVNRFDSTTERFVSYRLAGDVRNSFSVNDVDTLHLDRSGMLWVATSGGGLNRLDPVTEEFTHYRHEPDNPESLSSDWINSIVEDHDGVLWIGSDANGLNRFDPTTGASRHYRHRDGEPLSLSDDQVRDVAFGVDGSIWVVTAAGVDRYDAATDGFERVLGDVGRGLAIHGVRPSHADALWLATSSDGLARFDVPRGHLDVFQQSDRDPTTLSNNHVTSILEARDGMLWVATWDGVNRFDPSTPVFERFRHRTEETNSLSHDTVRAIAAGGNGVLWIGTDSGVNRFVPADGSFTVYRQRPGDTPSLGRDRVWAVHEADDGTVWVGSDEGLSRLDLGTERLARNPGTALSEIAGVRCIVGADGGGLWVGTRDSGLSYVDVDSGVQRQYRAGRPGGLSHDFVRDLVVGDDVLWIATAGGGLNRLHMPTQSFHVDRHQADDPESLSHDVVWTIVRSRNGTTWVGTDAGLDRIHPTEETTERLRFTRYATETAPSVPTGVSNILEDDAGRLWLGLFDGKIARFDPRDESFRYYDNGPVAQVGSFSPLAAAKSDDKLYFGGYVGFTAFNPSLAQERDVVSDLRLTDLALFGKRVVPGPDALLAQALDDTDAVVLNHDQNDISLGFVAFDYSDAAALQFNFRLIPYDADWRGWTTQRAAPYTSLPPGRFTFEVKAMNGRGADTDTRVLAITIRPPWWQSQWAYGSYALALLIGLVAVDRVRRARVIRQERSRALDRELEQARQLKEAFIDLDAAHQSLAKAKEHTETQAAQLRELDRVKSRFFADVSHEFRTPLTLILGPLQDLQSELATSAPEDASERVEMAIRNGEKVLDLVNEILDIAKIDSGELVLRARQNDLTLFIEEIARVFDGLAEHNAVEFEVRLPSHRVEAFFDTGQLEKVVTNLLSNAFKFTLSGGCVVMTLTAEEEPARAFIAIRDSGPGMHEDELPHLFDRFYQGAESRSHEQPSTGIGLALAKELTELHGGTIHVESKPGVGTTFTVVLPLGKAHLDASHLATDNDAPKDRYRVGKASLRGVARLLTRERTPDVESSEPVIAGDATTILIAEDNAEVRSYISKHFAGRYRVLEAANGREALERVRAELPDLVISDVMMPEIDGYALCESLKGDRETSFIPIVLLTAKAASEEQVGGFSLGADDYVTKPFDVRVLGARVDNLIRSRRQWRARGVGDLPRLRTLNPSPVEVASADSKFLERVQRVLEDRLSDESFNVESLASALAVDRSNLLRRLRVLLEETPTELIWRFRLDRAAQLLEARSGSVSEVAYSVGFKSVSHFSRRFQQRFGVTPSRYVEATVANPPPRGTGAD